MESHFNTELARVINEGNPVEVARVRGNFDWAMKIRVDDLQKLGRSMGGGRKGVSHHLASQTRFADGVWFGGGSDFEASDKVLSDHLLENRVAGVAEATMPEVQVHGKCGGGEICCFWDGNGGAFKVCSGGIVNLGNEEGIAVPLEVHDVILDDNGEVLSQREMEGRKC